MKRFKRRRYIISSLQVNLLLTMVVYTLGLICALGAMVFLPIALDMSDTELSQLKRAEASSLFLALHFRLWPAVLVILLVFGAHAVLLTHRIAGPLYRLRQVMGAAAGGDLTATARLRKNDMLKEEANGLNQMLRSFEARQAEIQEDCRQAQGLLNARANEGQAASQSTNHQELAACLARIQAVCQSAKTPDHSPQARSSDLAPPAALPQPGQAQPSDESRSSPL